MSQGTISVLFGCHSIIHSILVLISWIKLYKKFPKFWELVCIFIHDIGHIGLNYLDDYNQKKEHWKRGAWLAGFLFSEKGYDLVAGHDIHSNRIRSELYKPDKYSWYIAPRWWLCINCIIEPKLIQHKSLKETVNNFQKKVRKSIEKGEFKSTHQIYLERKLNHERLKN